MRIIKLHIEGFRSLKDVTWNPGALNVVIGPNGSGKSNILRSLELVSISAQGKLGKHVQRAGGIEPLLWDGQEDCLKFSVKTEPVETHRDIERDSLTYELQLKRLGKTSAYRIEHELLGNYYQVDSRQRTGPFKLLSRRGASAHVFDEDEHSLVQLDESTLPSEESLLSLASGPFLKNHHIPAYQAGLASWRVYHDLHVNNDAPIRQPVIARSENRVDPDGQNLVSVLHTLYTGDRDFKKDINEAMHAAFGDDFEELVFPPAADQRVQLRVRWKSLQREQSAADLSDGTLRFLFLLTVLATPSPPPVLAIDEPETGLHPAMLPIVGEYAVEASKKTQVIFTTHSPQILDAFGDSRPTTTITKWNSGQTVLMTLKDTDLASWLEEYSLGSLFRSGELEEIK